jgi:hypothetical protein
MILHFAVKLSNEQMNEHPISNAKWRMSNKVLHIRLTRIELCAAVDHVFYLLLEGQRFSTFTSAPKGKPGLQ